MERLSSYGRRHPLGIARLRFAIGIWLLILTAILCWERRWWGLALIAPAALHFYLAYRLTHRLRGW
ncbi:MAG: hypothetical protein ABSF58_00085 [Solirubrobacteraceae bacterium]|jgi:hypothetical protein